MKVSYWSLAVPLYVSSGLTLQTLNVGENGITSIEVLPSGMLLIGRGKNPTLVVHGANFGELTPESEEALRKQTAHAASQKPAAVATLPDKGSKAGAKPNAAMRLPDDSGGAA